MLPLLAFAALQACAPKTPLETAVTTPVRVEVIAPQPRVAPIWPPKTGPEPPELHPGQYEANRRATFDYLVQRVAYDLTQVYRADPLQYGSRDDLLFLPVAVYGVFEDDASPCVRSLAQRMSDTLGDLSAYPPFDYSPDGVRQAKATHLRPSEVGEWEDRYRELLERSDRVPPGRVYLEAPPLALMVLEAGEYGQLRVNMRILPLEQLPADVAPRLDDQPVFDYVNMDDAAAFRAQYAGGSFAPDLSLLCPSTEAHYQIADTRSQADTTVTERPWLDVHYQVTGPGRTHEVESGQVTCVGDQIIPTIEAPEGGYVYVLMYDSKDECVTIFPRGGQSTWLAPGERKSITRSDGSAFPVMGPRGVDRVWVHWSRRSDLDPQALLAELTGGRCKVDALRDAFAAKSSRYRSWKVEPDLDKPSPQPVARTSLLGDGETVEAIFPVDRCD